jgi:cyclomaltodextrinase
LVDEAHVNGLRVILDVVTNHLAEGSAYFSQATRLGVRSAYYAWFERDRSGQVKHYFDWHNLNNLNYDNPEVRAYLTASLAHWIRDFGFDGFRLDAAWAPRERAPEFWPQVRRELRRIDPQVALFAEASGRDPYYSERHFEAVYDWTGKLGEWAWNEVFAAAGATPDLARLRAALSATTDCAEREPLVVRFLDNNDTGARFGTRYGLGQNRAAAALLFTVAGLPVIYAGDEVGASYEPYGGLPIVWPNNTDLQSLYMRLIALRLGDPALRSGCLNLLSTDRDDSVIAFARRAAGTSGPRSVVAINFSSSETAVRLPGFGPIRLRPHDFAVLQDESSGRAAALGPR